MLINIRTNLKLMITQDRNISKISVMKLQTQRTTALSVLPTSQTRRTSRFLLQMNTLRRRRYQRSKKPPKTKYEYFMNRQFSVQFSFLIAKATQEISLFALLSQMKNLKDFKIKKKNISTQTFFRNYTELSAIVLIISYLPTEQ